MIEFQRRVVRAAQASETRRERRALVRALRGGRKGEKARTLLGRHQARAAIAVVDAARRAELSSQSEAGRMPHRPSGRHQKKLRDRREARSRVTPD